MRWPRLTADFPYQSQSDKDCDRGVQPFERAPVGIPDFEEAQRKQYKESRNRNQCSNCLSSSNFEFRISNFDCRPVLPAQPEKIRGEKWDEPAVAVLLADRPLVAQMSDKDKPKGADSGNSQRGAKEIAVGFEWDGLSLRER